MFSPIDSNYIRLVLDNIDKKHNELREKERKEMGIPEHPLPKCSPDCPHCKV
jgi:hypothetical protein